MKPRYISYRGRPRPVAPTPEPAPAGMVYAVKWYNHVEWVFERYETLYEVRERVAMLQGRFDVQPLASFSEPLVWTRLAVSQL